MLHSLSPIHSTLSSHDTVWMESYKVERNWGHVGSQFYWIMTSIDTDNILAAAETWDLSLHPKSLHLATAGLDAKVRVLSSAPENFGEELTTMQASGTFGTTVEYVSLMRSFLDHRINQKLMVYSKVTGWSIARCRD